MFLLEGAPAPDHATFARFRSIHFAPCARRILAKMSNALFDMGEFSGETIFIDGTKIETAANKYTFVWKKAVTQNQTKLLIKLADFVAECEQLYDLKIVYGDAVKIKHVKKNMEYDAESDIYICRNTKMLAADHIKHSKSRTGYVREKTIYKCEDCSGCPYKAECIKGNNCKIPLEERTKTLQVARTFLKYRQQGLKRILSDEGIVFRINRSIQEEGSFGDLKQDMQFRRHVSKGAPNALAESILLAMARNINKLHNKIQKGRTGTHLFPVKSA